jgi:hypothetical protein
MKKANTSKIQQLPNGQITINVPRAIAHAMGYEKGGEVAFEIAGDKLVPRTRCGATPTLSVCGPSSWLATCVALGASGANKRRSARGSLVVVPALRSCTVSYQDMDGVTHSVDVTAETLFEAAVLGMNLLRVERWHDNPNLKILVRVRQPETTHEVWNSALSAWLARSGRGPKEQALKARLKELLRHG